MTTSCPRCFDRLDPDSRTYACVGPCVEVEDPTASSYEGQPVSSFPMVSRTREGRRWQPPDTVSCRQCQKSSTEICPTCHYRLPPEWRLGTAVCIGLAGAPTTGKSVYVGVAVKQLGQMLINMNARLSFAPGPSKEIYKSAYERHLFVERKMIESTRKVADTREELAYQREPMIISMGRIDGLPRYVVFRDTAGEDLENPQADTTYLSYLRRAHAIFFLFDPTAVPQIKALLRGLIPEPLRKPGDPEAVLDTLLSIIGSASPRIAMIISKFDTLHKLQEHPQQDWRQVMSDPRSAFRRDPGIFDPSHDAQDSELLNLEVQSLLVRLGAQGFVNAMTNQRHGRTFEHQYFAVSALGAASPSEDLHPHGISPFRCLDPIRWVLANESLLPVRSRR